MLLWSERFNVGMGPMMNALTLEVVTWNVQVCVSGFCVKPTFLRFHVKVCAGLDSHFPTCVLT